MPYCLYVRKSRADAEAEARGEGETLTRHINTLLDLAKRLHLDVTQIHREIVSGETIAARPVMQQLLLEVEQGFWDGVLVMEVERLARGDTIDQGIVAQTFKFSNCQIITPTKTYDPNNEFDEEYFEFGLFMSRREYKTINRRLQTGRLTSVHEGKYVLSIAPYGYERVRLGYTKGFSLKPIPAEADAVRMMFTLFTKGEKQDDGTYKRLGISRIVRRLNELNIKPRKSKSWSPATVRDMLRNPIYAGKIRWNWRPTIKKVVDGRVVKTRPRNPEEKCSLYDGLHPALVSVETFNAAQELLRNCPQIPVNKSKTIMNPLAGIVYCEKCGLSMVRRPYGSKKNPEALMCPSTACNNVSAPLYLVERRVISALGEWLAKYRLQWEAETPVEDVDSVLAIKENALRRLISEYATLSTQLDNTHDLLEQGIYSTDQFLDRSRKLSERMKQNELDRSVLKDAIEVEKSREAGRKFIVPKVELLLDVYWSLPDAASKNELLKEVLEKVTYIRDVGGRWSGSQDNFQITLYPKIPYTGE